MQANVPVAGRGYNALPFVFDLVNHANGVRIADAPRKKPIVLKADDDGTQTLDFLKKVNKAVERVTTTHAGSLGIHPIVYFYTRGGAFQPSTFIGAVRFLDTLGGDRDELKHFTKIRRQFEDFLVLHKDFISKVVHKFGSGDRSSEWFYKLYMRLYHDFSGDASAQTVFDGLASDSDFAFLTVASPQEKESQKKTGFSRGVKTAAFFEEAMPGGVRCSVCKALVHRNSMHVDHIERKQHGGAHTLDNAAVAHPFCNSTMKN